ncbi:MAG: alpha/beta hydrolase [Rhodospirillales bacterium]|nr:alpha/beta hydrolase [Rhodospirillales bacterium]
MQPRLCDFPVLAPHGGFIRLAWAEWGPPDAPRSVVCVHGLSRNGRDFDRLAEVLAADGRRIVAPDIPGRGRSAWLADPADYGYPFYVAVMAALLARLGAETVDWIGTSMGGLIGMLLAAQPGTPIRRLALNDIGPFIPKAALERIGTYVGADPRFDDLAGVEAYLRRVHAPFGPLADDEWRHLAVHSAAPAGNGRLRLHYDPAIARPFIAQPPTDVDLWPVWDLVACLVLIVRGAESDLLLGDTARAMTGRGVAAAKGAVRLAEIAGVGHAPALMARDQIALIRDFLGTG